MRPAAAILLVTAAMVSCGGDGTPGEPVEIDGIVYLDQGWTAGDREYFYNVTQGSWLVPYSVFLALEQPDSEEPFFGEDLVGRYRYLPRSPSESNPDGLPVGWVKDGERDWLGFNCTACHTSELAYRGTRIRIDGGPTLGDSPNLLLAVESALRATLDDPAKFDRMVARLRGDGATDEQRDAMREKLRDAWQLRHDFNVRNASTHPYGFGRIDALGIIFNEVLADDLDLPENAREPDAPVSYPFIWDTPQHDFVEYNGSAPNAGLGSLGRNVGQVLGVWGNVEIEPGRFGYASSVRVSNLVEIEGRLRDLQSPVWPMEILGPIDRGLAAAGETLYRGHCMGCHALIDRSDPDRRVIAQMIPADEVGTDWRMAINYVRRRAKTGRLEGSQVLVRDGDAMGAEATGFDILANAAIGTIIAQPYARLQGIVDAERQALRRDHRLETLRFDTNLRDPAYKGRPLNGIWATAPFLHNGSVPNLEELLKPAGQRVTEFWVGNREFDPVSVGYVSGPFAGGFRFDTSVPGNSNGGHTYGTHLSVEERQQLVEFLKTL